MPLPIGAEAPGATLFAAPREPFLLTDHIGGKPTVLLFFPLAFSSTCTAEMCSVGEDYQAYLDLDARVFGISVDSPWVNSRFAKETSVPFPILSDFNREAMRAYDVVRPDLGGLRDVSERAVFVIGRNGRIHWVWQGENPGVMPPFDQVRTALRTA